MVPFPSQNPGAWEGRGTAPRPFQFTMATFLAVVAVYSVLFAILRTVGLQNGLAFAAITVYFTTLAFAQWSFFGGRRPLTASVLVSGILGAAGVLGIASNWPALHLSSLTELGDFLFTVGSGGFILGALIGIPVACIVDVALAVIESVGGMRRKLLTSPPPIYPRGLFNARSGDGTRGSRALRLSILTILVTIFAGLVLAGTVYN